MPRRHLPHNSNLLSLTKRLPPPRSLFSFLAIKARAVL